MLPAAVLVRAVAAVPAVCGGEQNRGPCSAPTHSAGAAAGLSEPGSPAVPQSYTTAYKQGNILCIFTDKRKAAL